MNQKDLIKWGLIALGAYLVYKYIEEQGGLANLFGATAGTLPSNCGANQTLQIKQLTALGLTLTEAQQQAICGATSLALSSVLTPAQMAVVTTAAAASKKAAPTGTGTGTGSGSGSGAGSGSGSGSSGSSSGSGSGSGSTVPTSCPTGQVMINGVCHAQNVSQVMLQVATTAGMGPNLSMDQWCFYYTQVTGQGCPFDPGAVDPSVYAGAGIVDRTTPTDVGTWLAIAQNQAPQLGLTGLGAFSIPRYVAPWLM